LVSFLPHSSMNLRKVTLFPGRGMIVAMKGGFQSRIMIVILPHSTMNSWTLEAEWNYCWCLAINSKAWLRGRDLGWLPPSSVYSLLYFHFGSQALAVSISLPLSRVNMAPKGCKPSLPPSCSTLSSC
jgi:hypothetical protein